jgi:hypothetical protein
MVFQVFDLSAGKGRAFEVLNPDSYPGQGSDIHRNHFRE